MAQQRGGRPSHGDRGHHGEARGGRGQRRPQGGPRDAPAGRRGGRAAETRFDAEPLIGAQLDYALLDSGGGQKLERFGPVTLARPAAQAIWAPAEPELWRAADARFERFEGGGGRWHDAGGRRPPSWLVELEESRMVLKTTDFGHLGVFPEQRAQWRWIRECCRGRELSVLNLFAYTGGSTLAAARGGARVCHVDAARGIVDWAGENARRSELGDAPVRWIVDDAMAFVQREVRRGRRYDGLILDPPSYGRGRRGETWKIELDLIDLLSCCRELLMPTPSFVLLSCHSSGFTPTILKHLVEDVVAGGGTGAFESGEMLLEGAVGARSLPTGCYARWCRDGLGVEGLEA